MILRLRAVLIFCTILGLLLFTHSATTKTQSSFMCYCFSNPGFSPVYFSNVFDMGTLAQDTNPIQNEFYEYLLGRFEYRTDSSLGATCPFFETMQRAQAQKRNYEDQLRQGGKQINEIEWTYTPNLSGPITTIVQHRMQTVSPQLPADHTFCFSDTQSGTIYVTGPLQTTTSESMGNWSIGFTQYLKQKYSFAGRTYCNIGPRPTAERLVSAHLQGARAANKNIVETGWRFDPKAVAAARQEDEDREPAPVRPNSPQVPQSELQLARADAQKDVPLARQFCQSDPTLKLVFNCLNFSHAVYAFRMAHHTDAGAKEPIASLVDDEKFPCQGCIDAVQVMFWVRRRATAEGLNTKTRECTVSALTKTLNANTAQVHHRLEQFYKESVAQCNQ